MDSKEKKMTKTYKAVLRSSLVMLSLLALAVVSSGVAQAQQCVARAISPGMVRAEGITEVVGNIELRCRRPTPEAGFGFEADIPDELNITLELNTNITNEVSDARVVKLEADAPGYQDGGIWLDANDLDPDFTVGSGPITAAMFGGGELTEDGDAIEWTKIATTGVNFTPTDTNQAGFNLIISGIRANASMVGDGEDIMANVMVGDTVVNSAPIKVADVTEGLVVKADVAEGLQCADTDDAMAVITIQEGFVDAIVSIVDDTGTADVDESANSDSLVVTFTGIPDGVMVMVPSMVAVGMIDDPEDEEAPFDQIPDPAAFSLMLREGTRTDGVGDIDEDTGLGAVELNTAGAGEVIYNIASYDVDGTDTASTDNTVNEEWVNLPVTFAWKSGGEMPVAIGGGYVDVSFHPVSSLGGVSFDDSKMPRFVASNDPVMVVEIDDCITTLLFPFVTNKAEFDTGMVISNTSEEAGSCTIAYSGADAPDNLMSGPVEGGEQWIALVSGIAKGFQGYITATCGFRDAFGFAFLANGFGVGNPTAAQSYLAVCLDCD
jgi:hypothetical protein